MRPLARPQSEEQRANWARRPRNCACGPRIGMQTTGVKCEALRRIVKPHSDLMCPARHRFDSNSPVANVYG